MRAAKYGHEAPTSRDVASSAALVSAGAFGAYLVFLGLQLRGLAVDADLLRAGPSVGWVAFFCIPLTIFWFSRRVGRSRAPRTWTRFERLVTAVMVAYVVIVVVFFANCFRLYAEIPEHLKR